MMNLNAASRVAVLAACLALPPLSLAEAPAARQRITHETLWMMKRVSSPAVSPEAGEWCSRSLSPPTIRTRR